MFGKFRWICVRWLIRLSVVSLFMVKVSLFLLCRVLLFVSLDILFFLWLCFFGLILLIIVSMVLILLSIIDKLRGSWRLSVLCGRVGILVSKRKRNEKNDCMCGEGCWIVGVRLYILMLEGWLIDIFFDEYIVKYLFWVDVFIGF